MTGFLLLLGATIVSIELVGRLQVIRDFLILSRLGGRAGRLLTRRGVSEWAKERAMRLLAARLMTQSLRGIGALAAVAVPFVCLLAIDIRLDLGVRTAWSDMTDRVTLLVLSTLYLLMRRRHRARAKGEVRGERLLQRLALGSRLVRELSFDLERDRYRSAANARRPEPPVFVTGLARAGTTVLMRALHGSGDFAALTYRDLPFPLAPNLWARLGGRLDRAVARSERAHGDGLLHDLDSPEAIEELFWRHREGAHYVGADGLRPTPPACDTIADFADYARLVQLRYDRPRYLSKNNNNVLRLPALLAAFPDAQLVHPFRDPVQQAASLLNQHRRACALAGEDPFRARFMTWLGHHEFGAGRRRFLLPGGPSASDDPDHVDYWLKSWIAVYRYLLTAFPEIVGQQIFVDYDELVGDGRATGAMLAERLQLTQPLDLDGLRPPAVHAAGPSPHLVREAGELHAALRRRAVAALARLDRGSYVAGCEAAA